ncbi:hypothetical protein FRC09_005489 [Ceratobasidium sp. 395]|nr:hypothetical protein FRC09_005489 [Ceratobasidium sp. 395]
MSLFNSESQKYIISRFIDPSSRTEDVAMDDGESNHETEIYTEDSAIYLELQSVEEQFLTHKQSPLNIAELRFDFKKTPDVPLPPDTCSLDLDSILDYLPRTSPITKQLIYRIEGYRRLGSILQNLNCESPELNARRSDLLAIISVESDRLLSEVAEELRHQATSGTHQDGARRIHFGHVAASPNAGRYISPVVSASVVLIAIIHCMMGVARDHCNLILKCLRCILQLVANMHDARAKLIADNHINPIPTTLPTALHYLGLQDDLDVYVVCPACDELYKTETDPDPPDQCTSVDIDGHLCDSGLFSQQHRGNRIWKKPIRRFTHYLLESWLSRFLLRPEVEDLLESAHPSPASLCTDVWGASYLANFPGNGEPSFFDCPPGELRLAFLVYYDHFNPLMLKISGKKRSSGLLMMVCLNLPPEVRYDLKNIYVTAMLPGPKEPTLDNINKFMRPIMDNLVEHYSQGVYISKTHKYPKGRKVRSAAAIMSMDIMASRPFAGIGGPSHTIFCSFCNAQISEIDNFACCSERTLEEYQIALNRWDAARTSEERKLVWADHAVRRSEMSRFEWWNPFTCTTIGPLHWTKNICEKHIRENMGCSTVLHSDDGTPEPPPLSRGITTVEAQWGYKALLFSSANELEKASLPEPLLRFMCRVEGIYEAGLPSKTLVERLNRWRKEKSVIRPDGAPAKTDSEGEVAMAKTEYYLSKVTDSLTNLESHSTVASLRGLCRRFSIPWTNQDKKQVLMEKLVEYYLTPIQKGVNIVVLPGTESANRKVVPLGLEVVNAVKEDMQRTSIPSWMKQPPINFATTEHGKLASEEYKSLALVSLPITLIRLWSTGNEKLRERLDNFLHLSVAIRILSYQSLTENDESYFDYHILEYLNDLKRLYPYSSITPVQHLGLHIPYFMRSLGPTTRYSENTCEMFIGMLEDIGTNFRSDARILSGELEQTLHRELIMAANLKAMMERWNFFDILQPYGEIISDFLQSRYAGSELPSSTGWHTKHAGAPLNVDLDTYASLSSWATSRGITPFTRRLHVCQQLRRGNVVYQSFRDSRGNSNISFRPRGVTAPVPGRIDVILQELDQATVGAQNPRILVLARTFDALTEGDAAMDPYRNHPIVGKFRFRIMQLYYDTVDINQVHIIEPDDIVSHVAVAKYVDSTNTLSAPCSVIVDLDLKHIFDS